MDRESAVGQRTKESASPSTVEEDPDTSADTADTEPPTSDPVDDQAVFATLYPALHRFAAVVCDADMDPDDIVQDALTRVLQRGGLADLIDPERYSKSTIVRIVANHRRDAGRHRRGDSVVRNSESLASTDHYPSEVMALVSGLQPIDRALLYLIDVQGYATADAAELCGLRPATTRSRIARARKRLNKVWRDHERAD